jgi:hypothetical protein
MNFNVTLPSKPASSKWSLSLSFPHPNPVCTSPSPQTRYTTDPSHSSRFGYLNDIMWLMRIIKVLLTAPIQSQKSKHAWVLRFQQQCNWEMWPSVMWQCVTWEVVCNILKWHHEPLTQ